MLLLGWDLTRAIMWTQHASMDSASQVKVDTSRCTACWVRESQYKCVSFDFAHVWDPTLHVYHADRYEATAQKATG